MNGDSVDDRWKAGDAYEAFMGRWSRRLAADFVHWLDPGPSLRWLEVGCGTGALTSAICRLADPSSVVASDQSDSFVEHLRSRIADARVVVVTAGADDLPSTAGGFDRVVSGLVLNFLPNPREAVVEMAARVRPGGLVAAYVWDYAGRMEFLRVFWDAAVAMDSAARNLDEGVRFPISRGDALETLFRDAELREVRSGALEIRTHFESFADYWQPFLGGSGPAPSYVAALSEEMRAALRDRLERVLAPGEGGEIDLVARAWAVRGRVV
jgi:SAM-dependent methyltransferase